jgi:hypothetical protein
MTSYSSTCSFILVGYLFRLLFQPEDRSITFLRNLNQTARCNTEKVRAPYRRSPGAVRTSNLTRLDVLEQCFSTAGPRPGTGPWHQLYRVPRLIKKRIYRAAVSQRLRTTVLEHDRLKQMPRSWYLVLCVLSFKVNM